MLFSRMLLMLSQDSSFQDQGGLVNISLYVLRYMIDVESAEYIQ